MPLPTSGNPISLSQIATEFGGSAPHSLSEYYGANAALPGSGAISMHDFFGLSAAISRTISSAAASLDISTLFDSGDWTGSDAKAVTLNSGVTHGQLTIPSNMGGTLTLTVDGVVQGTGGAASASGGDAIINSASNVTVVNNGTISGGGGGGGTGGAGGNSETTGTSTVREPSSGEYYVEGSPSYFMATGGMCGHPGNYWNGSNLGTSSNASITSGSYTYYRGSLRATVPGANVCGAPGPAFSTYGIYRTSSQTTTTTVTGGAGGAGGVGEGYAQTNAAGLAGTVVSGAGDGGTGGTGGTFGQAGATGSTGTNGDTTNGSAGSAGGTAGAAISGTSVTLTNNGTVNGTTV